MNDVVSKHEIIRFITGKCSAEERKKVEVWMDDAPENREMVKQYQKLWGITEDFPLEQDEDLAWQKLSDKISRPTHLVSIHELNKRSKTRARKKERRTNIGPSRKFRYQNWLYRIAAVFLLTLGVSYVLYTYDANQSETGYVEPVMREVVAGRGERMHITFNDGTSVVLNSSSAIRFPSRFDGAARQVELEGEAFFSVARKEKMPFLVYTDDAVVQVLGTKFNVNAYPGEETVEVVVADGKVAVRSDADSAGPEAHAHSLQDSEVVLTKGEYTSVRSGKAPSDPKMVILEHHLGWINGNLIFEATPLDMVIKKLKLYYDRDFIVSDSSLSNRRLTASFDKESLSKVLDVLAVTLDLEYEQKGQTIFLKPYEGKEN